MILGIALVAVFLYVVGTGPAGVEWRENRRARRQLELDRPLAKVIYLPSAGCRQPDDFARIEFIDATDI